MASFVERHSARESELHQQHGFTGEGPVPWSAASLCEAALELGAASGQQITAMRRHLASGRFGLEHFVEMYSPAIEAAALKQYAPSAKAWTEAGLLGALADLELASPAAVQQMQRHLASGRFPLQHYVAMWQPTIVLGVLTYAGRKETAPLQAPPTEAELFAKLRDLGLASEASVQIMPTVITLEVVKKIGPPAATLLCCCILMECIYGGSR